MEGRAEPCCLDPPSLTIPQGRHGENRDGGRRQRPSSLVLTSAELVEIRAGQRTFEGAYVRTAIGLFSFALIVLRIFTAEFYSVGALFALYGAGVLGVSLLRRQQGQQKKRATSAVDMVTLTVAGNTQFLSSDAHPAGLNANKFRTSGSVVSVMTALSIAAYICLLVFTLRLGA